MSSQDSLHVEGSDRPSGLVSSALDHWSVVGSDPALKLLCSFNQDFFDEEDIYDGENEIRIVRTKRFGIKPMFPEDACVEMELLGHNFYMFQNAETDQVNVVYKRKNNTYGLIEPEF